MPIHSFIETDAAKFIECWYIISLNLLRSTVIFNKNNTETHQSPQMLGLAFLQWLATYTHINACIHIY